MLAVRVWFTSFNPIFIDFFYNNMATCAGIILSLYLFVQDWRTPIIKSTDLPSGKVPLQESDKYAGVMVTGLGFGALIFLTIMFFGDVSIISRWTVAPYPNPGPYPYPWRYSIIYIRCLVTIIFTNLPFLHLHSVHETYYLYIQYMGIVHV